MARQRLKAKPTTNGHSSSGDGRRYFIADVEVDEQRHKRYQTFIRNAMSKMADNAMMMRTEWLQGKHGKDPRRDINKDCGYATDPTIEDYDELCRVEAVAERTATVWADETWQTYPDIFETNNEEEETDFETALSEMQVGLGSVSGKSYYGDRQNARLMDVFHRADRAAGRGRYSIILVGLNDGLELRQPVKGVKEDGSNPSKREGEDEQGQQIDMGPGRSLPGGAYNLSFNAKTKDKAKAKLKVKYLRVYPERYARITRVELNMQSPRFGMPVEYQITERDATNYGIGVAQERTRVVHWSRVIHVVTHPDEGNDVLGRPELQVPYRRIMDLQKLYGGSAEMFWLGAFGGIAFEAAADLLDAGADMDAMRDEVELYMNGLQRFLRLIGVQAKSLAPNVADPTSQIDVQLKAIAIYLRMPMRIFMGAERGELASQMDDAAWNDRVKHRQQYVIVPRLIIQFIDHMINIGCLPEPEDGYFIKWDDITSQTGEQQATIAMNRIKAMTTYTSAGGAELMSPLDFLVKEMKFDAEEAQEMLDSVLKAKREAQADQALAGALAAADAAAMAGQSPEGKPDEGGQPPAPGQPPGVPPGAQPGATPAPFGKKPAPPQGPTPPGAPGKKPFQPSINTGTHWLLHNAFASPAQRRAFFAKYGGSYKAAKERGFGPEEHAKNALDELINLTKSDPKSLHSGELLHWITAVSGPGPGHPLGSGEHRKRAVGAVVDALKAAPVNEQIAVRQWLSDRKKLANGEPIPREVGVWARNKSPRPKKKVKA